MALTWVLGTTVVIYIVLMYVLALVARSRIATAEDYIVAGRRLPFSLAWMTLMATWFGAGTLLIAADAANSEGLRAAALDPLGPALCLILAGLFIAGPMWRLQLLTLPDFFGRKFGRTAEVLCALIMVPSYFGWIAAQYVALASILQLYFGLELWIGIALVALVGGGYTVLGGMWSVTLTDAVQISLVLIGVVVLSGVVLAELGEGSMADGVVLLQTQVPAEKLIWIPTEDLQAFMGWIAVLAAASLGNLPAQDLLQRVFSSRSARVAQGACLFAGTAYLAFGMIPLGLGLAAHVLAPDHTSSVVPVLARAFLNPVVAIVFMVAVLSAVLSTIDSAIIAPSSVLAQNIVGPVMEGDPLVVNRWTTVFVAACSLAVAYAGESAYSLLEAAYAATLVGLFVPMIFGLYTEPARPAAALASMLVGTGVWLVHLVFGWTDFLQFLSSFEPLHVPIALAATALSLITYVVIEPPWRMRVARTSH